MKLNIGSIDSKKLNRFRQKLRVMERAVTDQLNQDTLCCGVTMAQCHTILEMGNQGTFTITALAKHLNLDKSTLSRTIESLVQMGYVNRRAKPDNRRTVLVSLSEPGKKVCKQLNARCNRFYTQLFNHLSSDQRQGILQGISWLADAFSKKSPLALKEASRCGQHPRLLKSKRSLKNEKPESQY